MPSSIRDIAEVVARDAEGEARPKLKRMKMCFFWGQKNQSLEMTLEISRVVVNLFVSGADGLSTCFLFVTRVGIPVFLTRSITKKN